MVPIDDVSHTTISNAVSRRTALRGLGGVGMATALGIATPHTLLAQETTSATMIEPEAGSWKTWVLSSGDQLRPEAPPALEHWVRGADIGPMPASLTIGVRQFLTRTGGLTPQARHHLGQDLGAQVLRHVSPQPPPGVHPEWVLRAVLAERRRRDLVRMQSEAARAQRVLPPDPLA